MTELLAALDDFPGAACVFTYPNADAGGRLLIDMIDAYVALNPSRSKAFVSLGQRRYLSLMKAADLVIGNSSSGLTEAPALAKATVNIGDRQSGRLKAASIIDVPENSFRIRDGIEMALSPAFQQRLPDTVSLYGRGGAGEKILEQLKEPLPSVRKTFFDIPHGN
jgi:UDP-N-acetylglucosamine 2-epimerase (non-hydrolysing)/GDP/UDP-N,N'-diacetylbacillosamine 2-epimerase (hydrolysing)